MPKEGAVARCTAGPHEGVDLSSQVQAKARATRERRKGGAHIFGVTMLRTGRGTLLLTSGPCRSPHEPMLTWLNMA